MRTRNIPNIKVILIFALAACWVYPLFLVIFNSFKSYEEIFSDFLALPTVISFASYIETWEMFNFPKLIFNTFSYTVITVACVAIMAPMAAYMLSRTHNRASKVIFYLLIMPAMVPFQSYMTTLIKLFGDLSLVGTRHGYLIVMVGMAIPGAIFMIHGFIKNVPIELEECAYLDGASRLRIYFTIVFPLLAPIVTTVLVLNTLSAWNDVLINMLVLGGREDTQNLSYALFSKFSSQSSDWEHALPGIVMAILPNIFFFMFMQKYIVEGITAGAVKG